MHGGLWFCGRSAAAAWSIFGSFGFKPPHIRLDFVSHLVQRFKGAIVGNPFGEARHCSTRPCIFAITSSLMCRVTDTGKRPFRAR